MDTRKSGKRYHATLMDTRLSGNGYLAILIDTRKSGYRYANVTLTDTGKEGTGYRAKQNNKGIGYQESKWIGISDGILDIRITGMRSSFLHQ